MEGERDEAMRKIDELSSKNVVLDLELQKIRGEALAANDKATQQEIMSRKEQERGALLEKKLEEIQVKVSRCF